MRAWVYTGVDLATLGGVYFLIGKFLSGDPTLAGYAVSVAGYTLLKTYKEKVA